VYLKWGKPVEARDAFMRSLELEDSLSVRTYIAEANKLIAAEESQPVSNSFVFPVTSL
jgi:hypothetical protein